MVTRTYDTAAVARWAADAAAASARLERREVPAEYVRPRAVEEFLESVLGGQ